jgi:hypothetical protein
MDEFVELSYDKWVEIYQPMKNPIDPDASMDGYMFETYGDEVALVKNQDADRIWMYGDGDDGGTYIWNGWGFVNRIGYFITKVPCEPNTTIQVLVSHNWYYCENCHEEMEDPDNEIRDAFQDIDLDKCPNCATPEELAETGYKPAGV